MQYINTLDLETYTGSLDFTYAWSVAFRLYNKNYIVADIKDESNNLDLTRNIIKALDLIRDICKSKVVTFYVHNLKFDKEFFLYYLLANYEDVTGQGLRNFSLKDKQFMYVASDLGQWYTLTFNYKGLVIEFIDSYKLLPFSLDKLAKDFKVQHTKLTMNYEDNYLTSENKDYILNDIIALSEVIQKFRSVANTSKNTIASSAYDIFIRMLENDNKDPENLFPRLSSDIDLFCRKSYKGGFCYVNKKYQGKTINKKGQVYDVNSLYPYIMQSDRLMPVGEPVTYKKDNKKYVNIYKISCKAIALYHPFIFNKSFSNKSSYMENIDTDTLKDLCLYVTDIDLQIIKEFYKVEYLHVIETVTFRAVKASYLFKNYINKYAQMKIAHAKEKDAPYHIAKLLQNSLYGKFGSSYELETYKFNEDLILKSVEGSKKECKQSYVCLASFITAYARDYIIRNIMKHPNEFLYCDTDSIHMLDIKDIDLDIDSSRYGAFKLEYKFSQAKYIRQKCYIEKIDNDNYYTGICGLSKDKQKDLQQKLVNKELKLKDIGIGFTCKGKRQLKKVKGGYIITDTDFTIK